MKKYKVIQCYTGTIGSHIGRLLIDNPKFELVGCLVHSDDKHGQDVGELLGVDPIGVKATQSIDEICALDADCASYNGLGGGSDLGGDVSGFWDIGLVARLLRSGINVYSGWGGWYPEDKELQILTEACAAGDTSVAAAGNVPGLVSDAMPIFASGFTTNITRIHCRESDVIFHYPSAISQAAMGIGRSMEDAKKNLDPAPWEWLMRQSAKMVMDAIGAEMTDFRLLAKDLGAAPEEIHLPKSGVTIAKGHVAGVRWTYGAFSGDRCVYSCEVELPTVCGLGKGWRQSMDEPEYTVTLEGKPGIKMTFASLKGADDIQAVIDINAARAINMIPLIIEAQAGCQSMLSMPFISAK